jgi:Leucine-rich repeat (LRR) protein
VKSVFGSEESELVKAVELHVDEELFNGQIEIKNEKIGVLSNADFTYLDSKFIGLRVLNMSMNHISSIQQNFNLPLLTDLILADNLIKELHPFTFQKLTKLKVLDLSIN